MMLYWFPLVQQLYNWREVTVLNAMACMRALVAGSVASFSQPTVKTNFLNVPHYFQLAAGFSSFT